MGLHNDGKKLKDVQKGTKNPKVAVFPSKDKGTLCGKSAASSSTPASSNEASQLQGKTQAFASTAQPGSTLAKEDTFKQTLERSKKVYFADHVEESKADDSARSEAEPCLKSRGSEAATHENLSNPSKIIPIFKEVARSDFPILEEVAGSESPICSAAVGDEKEPCSGISKKLLNFKQIDVDSGNSVLPDSDGGFDPIAADNHADSSSPSRSATLGSRTTSEGQSHQGTHVEGNRKSSFSESEGVREQSGKSYLNHGDVKLTRSWRGLFTDNRAANSGFKLEKIHMESDVVKIERSMIDPNFNEWKFCLVGWFTGKFPGFQALKSLATDQWKAKVTIHRHDSGWFVFKFDSIDSAKQVMEKGPYRLFGSYLMIKEMKEFFCFDASEITKLPVWVQIRNLPTSMWQPKTLSAILSAIGNPLYSDKLTASGEQKEFARALVEIDITRPVRKEIPVSFPDGSLNRFPICFEKLPYYCSKCRSLGHLNENCQLQEVNPKQDSNYDPSKQPINNPFSFNAKTAPKSTLPKPSAPKSSAPKSTAPKSTVPKYTNLNSTFPGSSSSNPSSSLAPFFTKAFHPKSKNKSTQSPLTNPNPSILDETLEEHSDEAPNFCREPDSVTHGVSYPHGNEANVSKTKWGDCCEGDSLPPIPVTLKGPDLEKPSTTAKVHDQNCDLTTESFGLGDDVVGGYCDQPCKVKLKRRKRKQIPPGVVMEAGDSLA